MVVEQAIVNTTNETLVGTLVVELGKLGLWIQGLGLIIIIWLIFQTIIAINNRIKRKALYRIEERLETVEKKIDKLLDKKK